MYGARERVKRILTLNEWALNDDQRLLNGRAASIVVGAMEMYNAELELRNLGLQRQILTHAASATGSQLQSHCAVGRFSYMYAPGRGVGNKRLLTSGTSRGL